MASVFLESVLNKENAAKSEKRPSVTLTFAQSIDAKIAGKDGQQLILSGKESMVMTHWMRTMHDAILVGIGTALNDDPQLNTRHLPAREPDPVTNGHAFPYHLPRPVILDAQLRLPSTCKLLNNYRSGVGRRPWVICAAAFQEDWSRRRIDLEAGGARVIPVEGGEYGFLPIPVVLQKLHELGIGSLMVEGGARVIASFFAHAHLVDSIIVTVAPKFVGIHGVGYGLDASQVSHFTHHSSHTFGKDTVLALVQSAAAV